jgi:hypothetical protein
MGAWCPTSSWPWIPALRPRLSPQPSSLAPLSREWRQRWHQRRQLLLRRMRRVTVRSPPCRLILVGGRARAMRARMAVVVVGGVGKDAIVAAAINHCHSRQCQQRHHWLNPTATAVDNALIFRRRRPPLLLPHSQRQQPPEASGRCSSSTAAMAVIVDKRGGRWQPRQ